MARKRRSSQLTWDKKKKKFIKGDGAGADNVKLIKTESGVKLPATYRSGRFDEWKNSHRKSLPRVGEMESEDAGKRVSGGRKFKHKKFTEARPVDKLSLGFERKMRKVAKSTGEEVGSKGGKGKHTGRYGGKALGQVKNELKTVDQIKKARDLKAKRKAKNARPSRKKKGKR